MRLEIADTPVSPQHLATRYKEARQRLLAARPKPKPVDVVHQPLPSFVRPAEMSWSMRFNAGRGVSFRFGNAPTGMSLTKICDAVCRHFDISYIDLCSHRRTKNLVVPRHIVMHLARKYTGRSMPEIGRWLGKRDHTTILHGVRTVAQNYERFRFDVEAIEKMLAVK